MPFACIMNGPVRRRRPRRSGGRHGLEEPQGHRRARHRPATGLRPRGREGVQHLAAPPSTGPTSGCSRCWPEFGTGGPEMEGHGGDRPPSRAQLARGPVRRGIKNVHGGALKEKMSVGSQEGCFGCPLRCKKRLRPVPPTSATKPTAAPNTRPCAAWAPTVEVDDAEAMVKANEICNAYSLDVISAGNTVSFAMECFEKGLLTLEDTGGLELRLRQRPGAGEVRASSSPSGRASGPCSRRAPPGGSQDRPGSRSALGGDQGRPSGHARTPPPARVRPRLHGEPQRRPTTAPTSTTTSSPPSTACRTSTAWASTTRCRSGHRPAQGGPLQRGPHPRVPQRLPAHSVIWPTWASLTSSPVEILTQGHRVGRELGRADPQLRSHPDGGSPVQRHAGSDGGRRRLPPRFYEDQDRRPLRRSRSTGRRWRRPRSTTTPSWAGIENGVPLPEKVEELYIYD